MAFVPIDLEDAMPRRRGSNPDPIQFTDEERAADLSDAASPASIAEIDRELARPGITPAARAALTAQREEATNGVQPVARQSSFIPINLDEPQQKVEDDVSRGLSTSFQQLPQLGYGLAAIGASALETAVGPGGLATAAKEWAVGKYQDWGQRIAANAKDTDEFDVSWNRAKEGDFGALVDWLQYGLGYAVGQGVQMLGTAGVGSLVGKAALKGAAEKYAAGLVTKEAAAIKGAQEVGRELTEDQIQKAAVRNVASQIGQWGAIGASAFGMEGGEIGGDLAEKSVTEGRTLTGAELGKAFAATALAGSLEFAADKLGLDTVMGRTKFGLGNLTGIKGRAARGAAGVAVNAPAEFGTEYGQTLLEEYGKGNPVDAEAQRQALNAGALGAVGGAVHGVAGGVMSSPAKQPTQDIIGTGQPSTGAPVVSSMTIERGGKKGVKVTRNDGSIDIDGIQVVAPKAKPQPEPVEQTVNKIAATPDADSAISVAMSGLDASLSAVQSEIVSPVAVPAVGESNLSPLSVRAQPTAMQLALQRAQERAQEKQATPVAEEAPQAPPSPASQASDDVIPLTKLFRREQLAEDETRRLIEQGYAQLRDDGTLKGTEAGFRMLNRLKRQPKEVRIKGTPVAEMDDAQLAEAAQSHPMSAFRQAAQDEIERRQQPQNGSDQAQGGGVAQPQPGADGRIFGMTPAAIGAKQGGGMDMAGMNVDPELKAKRDAEDVAARKALVERQRAEQDTAIADAAQDPRIAALKDAGIPAPQLLQAARELKAGDDSLVRDLARINDIKLPEPPSRTDTPAVGAPASQAQVGAEQHDYSSTQTPLPVAISDQVKQAAQRIIAPEDVNQEEGGLEQNPHITVKYGLHTESADDVRPIVEATAPVKAKITGIEVFKNDEGDVVVARVDSPDLTALNKRIKDALPNTETYPDYKPHITLGYVKKGAGEKYAKAKTGLEGQEITLDTVEFSGRNGDVVPIRLQGQQPQAPVAIDKTPTILGRPVSDLSDKQLRTALKAGSDRVRGAARAEIERRTKNSPQSSESASQQPNSGPAVETFTGQYKLGMIENNAARHQKRLASERPEFDWRVEQDDKLRYPFVVRGYVRDAARAATMPAMADNDAAANKPTPAAAGESQGRGGQESAAPAVITATQSSPGGDTSKRAVRADESGSPESMQTNGAAGSERKISTIAVERATKAALLAANDESVRLAETAVEKELRSMSNNGRGPSIEDLQRNPEWWDAGNEQLTDAGFAEYDRRSEVMAREAVGHRALTELSDLNGEDQAVQAEAFEAFADSLGLHVDFDHSMGGSFYVTVSVGDESYKVRFADHFNTVRNSAMKPDFNVAPGRSDFTEAIEWLQDKVGLNPNDQPAGTSEPAQESTETPSTEGVVASEAPAKGGVAETPASPEREAAPVRGEGEAAQTEPQAEVAGREAVARFEIGKSLTKEQRKQVLATLTDVYKTKQAPRELKYIDERSGQEVYGYVHSPELFEKSDITGAMVRYYVTLPDGRIAHPTELFPDYTQNDIDAELRAQRQQEENATKERESRAAALGRRKAGDIQEANKLYWQSQRGANVKPEDTVLLTNGAEYVRTHKSYEQGDLSILGEGWRVYLSESANPLTAAAAALEQAAQAIRQSVQPETKAPADLIQKERATERVAETKKPEEGPEFSREKRGPARYGMTVAQLQSQGAETISKFTVPVVISETPQAAGKKAGIDVYDDAIAFAHDGKIHAIASAIPNPMLFEAAMWHEGTHIGLHLRYGLNSQAYKAALDRAVLANAGIREAARDWREKYGADKAEAVKQANKRLTDNEIAEVVRYSSYKEALAEMSEKRKDQPLKFIEQLALAMQRLMRAMGLNRLADFIESKTDAEALSLMRHALDAVTKPGMQLRASNAPAYMRDGDFSRSQTRSEAFQRWFAGSKVVDENGEPLVVYHGTNSEFAEFDPQRAGSVKYSDWGEGIYFTPSPSTADYYRGEAAKNADPESEAMFRQLDEMERRATWKNGSPTYPDGYFELLNKWRARRGVAENESGSIVPAYVSIKNPFVVEYQSTANPGVGITARERGHDGIIVLNGRGEIDEVIAFRPEQIKSAIGNNGDFNPDSANIMFKRGAEVKARESLSWDAPEPSKMDNLIYRLQDRQIDTKRVLQAIRETTGELADARDVYLQEELFHGRAAKATQDFIDGELRPLVTEMAMRKVEMPELEAYLHARHAVERNAQIAKINPDMPDGGSGMTNAEAQEYFAKLDPKKKAAFEALAKRVDAITAATRRTLIDYGLESADTIKAWGDAYEHYVPLYREDLESTPGTGQGFSVRGPASKRAMGSKKAVVDIIANIAMQRERAIVRGEKNRVANALIGLAKDNPRPDFWQVDRPPTIRYVDPRTGLVTEAIDPLHKSRDNVVVARIPDAEGKIIEHTVTFNEADERAMRMAHALKNLDMDQLGEVLGTAAKITRYFSSINTQYNPVFGVVNILRDTQGALFNLSTTPLQGKQKEVLQNTVSALRGIYIDLRDVRAGKEATSSWASLWEEFQREGGQTGYRDMFRTSKDRAEAIEREIRRVGEGKAKNFGRAVFDWLSDYNTAMENAVRLAAYKAAKDMGVTNQRAASIAKNLTVNFNRKGQAATQVGALYAFFNASVQGTARLAETLNGPMGRKIIAGGIALGAMQALWLAAAGFDDGEPPQFVRERALIIPIGYKKYLTIPMPLGFHVIPNIGRMGVEFVLSGFRDPAKRITDFVGMFTDAFNPVGNAGLSLQTIAPTIVDPLAALAENRDWTGKPIARENFNSLRPTPGHTRAKDTASEFSKAISKALNWMSGGTNYQPGIFSPTPDQIDYLIGQATGGLGREAIKLEQTVTSTMTGEELPTYKIPLLGRFYGSSEGQAPQGSAFYANLKAIHQHEAEIKGRRKAGEPVVEYLRDNPEARLVRFANHAERVVSDLRRKKRELLEKGAPQASIRLIDERITVEMRRLNERVRALREREAA